VSLAILLGVTVAAAGCGPDYGHTGLSLITTPPVAVTLDQPISLPTGIGVGILARPVDTGGHEWPLPDPGASDDFQLFSSDSTILEVVALPATREYLLLAHSAGTAELLISVGGQGVDEIPVDVEPQQPPPQ
jgi:hypothetical protein